METEMLVGIFIWNHRMVGIGRDLWNKSSRTRFLKQVYLEQITLDLIQMGFQYL